MFKLLHTSANGSNGGIPKVWSKSGALGGVIF